MKEDCGTRVREVLTMLLRSNAKWAIPLVPSSNTQSGDRRMCRTDTLHVTIDQRPPAQTGEEPDRPLDCEVAH